MGVEYKSWGEGARAVKQGSSRRFLGFVEGALIWRHWGERTSGYRHPDQELPAFLKGKKRESVGLEKKTA